MSNADGTGLVYFSENSIAGANILLDALHDKRPMRIHDILGAGESGGQLANALYLKAAPDFTDSAPYDNLNVIGNDTMRRISLDGTSDEALWEGSRPRTVGIFLRDFKFHGANNRLISWALSLSALGIDIHIYTGCPRYNVERERNAVFQRLSAVKSMSIHYHDLFSHQGATDIVNMATDHGKESSPEFSAVVAALRTLDAVVVTNCGGEVTTHLFLWMASLGKHTNGPVIMMDMSNIVFVHKPFYSLVDIFLVSKCYLRSP